MIYFVPSCFIYNYEGLSYKEVKGIQFTVIVIVLWEKLEGSEKEKM